MQTNRTSMLWIIEKRHTKPSKSRIRNTTHDSFDPIAKYSREQVAQILHAIGGTGKIVTDAQLASWLKTVWGEGEYHIKAWQYGYKGYWSFIRIYCGDRQYRRLKRKLKIEAREARSMKDRQLILERNLSKEANPDKRAMIQSELTGITQYFSVTEDNAERNTKSKRYGPIGYVRAILPCYFDHDYQDHTELPPTQAQGGEEEKSNTEAAPQIIQSENRFDSLGVSSPWG